MKMNTVLETTEVENEEIEKYLSNSIMDYGIEQMDNKEPVKSFCSLKDHKGNIIGGVMGYKTLNLFFITHLHVEKQNRNNGYAKKLLSAIENQAKLLGCNIIRLNTLNKITSSLYSNAGFELTNTIPNYMNGFELMYFHKHI